MNNKPEDKFEHSIRQRLRLLESEPAVDAWDRIAADLPPVRSWYGHRWMVVLVLLIVLVGGLWWAVDYVGSREKNPALLDVSENNPVDSSILSGPQSTTPVVLPKRFPRSTELSPLSRSLPQDTSLGQSPQKEQVRSREKDSAPTDYQLPYQKRYAFQDSTEAENLDQPYAKAPIDRQPKNGLIFNNSFIEKTAHRSVARPSLLVALVESSKPAMDVSLPTLTFQHTRLHSEMAPPLLEPETVVLSASRWEAWMTASPLLLYQRAIPNTTDSVYVVSLDRATFSKDRWGAQISAGALYALNERWAVKMGFFYRYTRNQWTYRYRESLTDSFQVVRSDANALEAIPVYPEQTGTINQTNHHLGALVGVQYRLDSRWNSNIIGTELQAQQQAGALAWYAHASYVAEKSLNDHWSVSGGLNFLWNLSTPVSQGEYLELKPYGFGAQVGISYKLRFGRW